MVKLAIYKDYTTKKRIYRTYFSTNSTPSSIQLYNWDLSVYTKRK